MYLGLSILDISKTKLSVQLKTILRDRVIIHIKSKNAYEDIANVNRKRFDTWNYEINGPLTKAKNKKVIGSWKMNYVKGLW